MIAQRGARGSPKQVLKRSPVWCSPLDSALSPLGQSCTTQSRGGCISHCICADRCRPPVPCLAVLHRRGVNQLSFGSNRCAHSKTTLRSNVEGHVYSQVSPLQERDHRVRPCYACHPRPLRSWFLLCLVWEPRTPPTRCLLGAGHGLPADLVNCCKSPCFIAPARRVCLRTTIRCGYSSLGYWWRSCLPALHVYGSDRVCAGQEIGQ